MSKHAYVKAYPKEFREQVVKLLQMGVQPVRELAQEFADSSRAHCVAASRMPESRLPGHPGAPLPVQAVSGPDHGRSGGLETA